MPSETSALRQLMRAAGEPPNPEAAPLPPRVQFRSGRVLTLLEGRDDSMSVTSPDGVVELTVRFTELGPVLSFSGARLDLSHAGELNLSCGQLRLHGRRGVEVRSEAEVVVRGEGDVHVDGRNVLLNCDERTASSRR
jgi:hypothetical protein